MEVVYICQEKVSRRTVKKLLIITVFFRGRMAVGKGKLFTISINLLKFIP